MQRMYLVPTVEAFAVYEPEVRLGIQTILNDARDKGNNRRTQDSVWEELCEHVAGAPYSRLWFTLDDGVLVAWLAGKTYVDGRKRTGCITWAWAAPGCTMSRALIEQAEAFFRERECQTAALGRGFLQPAFTRLMRRYGYTMATVVYEKPLESEVQDDVDSLRPPSGEIRSSDDQRDGEPVPAEGADTRAAPDVRYAGEGVSGPDGEAAGDSNQRSDAASSVDDAGNGADDAGGVRAAGIEAESAGNDWQWDLFGYIVAPGRESTGAPDPGTTRPPGP